MQEKWSGAPHRVHLHLPSWSQDGQLVHVPHALVHLQPHNRGACAWGYGTSRRQASGWGGQHHVAATVALAAMLVKESTSLRCSLKMTRPPPAIWHAICLPAPVMTAQPFSNPNTARLHLHAEPTRCTHFAQADAAGTGSSANCPKKESKKEKERDTP